MPRGDRTRLMASEVPLMYGMVVEVVTVGVCEVLVCMGGFSVDSCIYESV